MAPANAEVDREDAFDNFEGWRTRLNIPSCMVSSTRHRCPLTLAVKTNTS